jgi:tRNA (mo5U34)-methyltransferase
MMNQQVALQLIQDRRWHHDFEIIPGVRTHGSFNPEGLWRKLQLPDELNGLSLADIGASNGYFSFAARQRGARVVAFDFRHKDNSGFGLAQYINGLGDIEHHHVNVLDISSRQYGRFDIVLALGLLYHVPDPFRALTNCADLARDRLLVESYCIDSLLPPPLATSPVMRFIPDPERFPDQGQPNSDRTNFWGFTSDCLRRLLEELGFSVNRTMKSSDRVLLDASRVDSDGGAVRQSRAYGIMAREPVGANSSDPAAWKMF